MDEWSGKCWSMQLQLALTRPGRLLLTGNTELLMHPAYLTRKGLASSSSRYVSAVYHLFCQACVAHDPHRQRALDIESNQKLKNLAVSLMPAAERSNMAQLLP